MNVRKRTLNTPVGPPPRNANTKAKPGESQAGSIRNAHNQPKPKGYSLVRNAHNG